MKEHERMARMIAECLEQYLHEYGWVPYRYPSGEHKGVSTSYRGFESEIVLIPEDGGHVITMVLTDADDCSDRASD